MTAPANACQIVPGPENCLVDVAGIRVGHATDPDRATGVTVILPDRPAIAAVDPRGGGTGTRETALLDAAGTVQAVHGLVLSGGSAFGLAAADGVAAWLRQADRGFRLARAVVPIVPAAVIFDIAGGAEWGLHAPYRELGLAAAEAATDAAAALGSVGAGRGAKAHRLKGGVGTASFRFTTGGAQATVAALAVVNPMGSVVVPGTRAFWARPFEQSGEFGDVPLPPGPITALDHRPVLAAPGTNTTIAVVATDLALTRPQAERVAIMAQAGLARAIRPIHGPLDGDTVFALATGAVTMAEPTIDLGRAGMLAADCLARAVARGVHAAAPVPSLPDLAAWCDLPRD